MRNEHVHFELPAATWGEIHAGAETVERIVVKGALAYGINTGFGKLANTHIPADQLEVLQRNLVLSRNAGVGVPLPDLVVRLTLLLKIASLARALRCKAADRRGVVATAQRGRLSDYSR